MGLVGGKKKKLLNLWGGGRRTKAHSHVREKPRYEGEFSRGKIKRWNTKPKAKDKWKTVGWNPGGPFK